MGIMERNVLRVDTCLENSPNAREILACIIPGLLYMYLSRLENVHQWSLNFSFFSPTTSPSSQNHEHCHSFVLCIADIRISRGTDI